MCGLAGIVAPPDGAFAARRIEPMTQSLAHRGPDDFGFVAFAADGPAPWTVEGAGPDSGAVAALGSRRLAILDLSAAGHQPMSDPQGRFWLAYNGEVYNYIELRRELEAAGHEFHSGCDTEVVLAAYRHWGADCFARFNGMWALAIWDSHERRLVLSRDRLGVKPLYIHRPSGGGLMFGSEIKALLADPSVPNEPDLGTVYNYAARHYRWVDGHRPTFFAAIEHLPAGTVATLHPDGSYDERRFWKLDPERFQEGVTDD